jgi:hypothetical protein
LKVNRECILIDRNSKYYFNGSKLCLSMGRVKNSVYYIRYVLNMEGMSVINENNVMDIGKGFMNLYRIYKSIKYRMHELVYGNITYSILKYK